MKRPYNVLVVEDDKSLTNAVKIKLNKNGFAVAAASTLDDALKHIYTDPVPIDAMWLDHYLLGTGTGLDILEKTRSSDQYKHIPAFIVSNTAEAQKQQAYSQLGAVHFYVKAEHRLDEIINDIRECLANRDNPARA